MRLLNYTLETQWVGTDETGTMEIDDDMSDIDIEKMLFEMAVEYHQPSGYINSIEPIEDTDQ